VTAVARLVTFADVDDADVDEPRRISVSVRHEAALADGRRVLLLDDRGWSSSVQATPEDGSGICARTSIKDIEDRVRSVVGPDEPFDGRSRDDMEADYWACLADVLGKQGAVVDGPELRGLPHDVVLSARLVARAEPDRGGAASH
jgi:hypothetical protein